jgi:hypothetical protein
LVFNQVIAYRDKKLSVSLCCVFRAPPQARNFEDDIALTLAQSQCWCRRDPPVFLQRHFYFVERVQLGVNIPVRGYADHQLRKLALLRPPAAKDCHAGCANGGNLR